MDSVRFGRALGFGARAAAKTLVTAMDAASSPNPSGASAAAAAPAASATASAVKTGTATAESRPASGGGVGQQAVRAAAQVLHSREGLKRGSRRFGAAVWGPFVKLSGVLWLELTGVFFGIFALTAAGAAWKERAGMFGGVANHTAHERFLWAAVVAGVFGYFCVSSFVNANRKSRGR